MFRDCPTHPASHHPCVPERVLILSRIGIACHCFLWREEGGDTAFPPAADVNSFLIVDGGERDCEASALITGKPRTSRIDGARRYRWARWMRLRLAAGAAGIVMDSTPNGKAEPGGGSVPAGPACSAQLDRRELGLTGHWHQLTHLPKAHIGCPEGQ